MVDVNLYQELLMKNVQLRSNISALDRRMNNIIAERDRAEQSVRDLTHELDHYKRLVVKAKSLGVDL